jgi:O-antigen/teichoic acid export membrane protein
VSTGRRLTRQVTGSAVVNVWLIGLSLFTTPFILVGLGKAAYGIFALVGVISAYLSNLEFGFGYATIRYVARAQGLGDVKGQQQVIETSFAVFLGGGLVGALVLILTASDLVRIVFHVDSLLEPEAVTAFRLAGVIFACTFLSSFFASVLQALGRFDWLNWAKLVFGTTSSCVAVTLVAAGAGIGTLFIGQTCVAFASTVLLGFAVIRVRRQVIWPRVECRILREMGMYGLLTFVTGFAYQWMINGPALILGTRVNTSVIPAFAIPHAVLQKLLTLVSSASLAFFPFASAAATTDDRSRLGVAFVAHLRLTILVMGGMAAFLSIFAPVLLETWVNKAFAIEGAPCLRLLAITALVLGLSGPPADVARGLGRPSWVLAYTSVVAFLGVGFSLILIPAYGPVGAAAALLLSITVGTIPFLFIVARLLLKLNPADVIFAVLPALAMVIFLAAIYEGGTLLTNSLLGAVVSAGVGTTSYALVVFRWILSPGERNAFGRIAVSV